MGFLTIKSYKPYSSETSVTPFSTGKHIFQVYQEYESSNLNLINFIDNLLFSVNWIQGIKVSSHYEN